MGGQPRHVVPAYKYLWGELNSPVVEWRNKGLLLMSVSSPTKAVTDALRCALRLCGCARLPPYAPPLRISAYDLSSSK
eukprot:1664328-Pyramimonas_sp.AAC.2